MCCCCFVTCNTAFEEATAQEPYSGQNRSQLASQSPVCNYKYPSNSPAKIPVGSIHSSPVSVNSKTNTSPSVPLATNDPETPVAHIIDTTTMYQTTKPFLEGPQHPSPSTYTGNSLQPKRSNSQNAPLTTLGQQTPVQLHPSAYTQLVTSVVSLSHNAEDDTNAAPIAGDTNYAATIGDTPR